VRFEAQLDLDLGRIVFIDETAATTDMSVVMVGLRARSAAASLSPWALQDDNRHRRLAGEWPMRGRSHGGRHEFRK